MVLFFFKVDFCYMFPGLGINGAALNASPLLYNVDSYACKSRPSGGTGGEGADRETVRSP